MKRQRRKRETGACYEVLIVDTIDETNVVNWSTAASWIGKESVYDVRVATVLGVEQQE